MPEPVKKHISILAHLGLFYAAAIWGSTFFMVKSALSGVDAVTMVGYRFMIAGLIMLVFLMIRRRSVLHGLGRAIWLGFLLWSLYIPQTVGLKYTTASNSGFITGLFVAFVPLFLRLIFKRKPSLMEVAASIVALIGLWTLTGGLHDVNLGDILTLLAAMTYALHLLYVDKFLKADLDPLVLSCQQFFIVGVLSLLTSAILGLPFEITTASAGRTIVFLAIFPTLLAFVVQMLAQKVTSPLRVSLVFALEPVFAGLFAWTLGGEPFVTYRAIGGLMIFAALVISGLPVPGRPKPARSAS